MLQKGTCKGTPKGRVIHPVLFCHDSVAGVDGPGLSVAGLFSFSFVLCVSVRACCSSSPLPSPPLLLSSLLLFLFSCYSSCVSVSTLLLILASPCRPLDES